MKSYIQGIITGGVLVFALLVLMGANDKPKTKWILHNGNTQANTITYFIDAESGDIYTPFSNIAGTSLNKVKIKKKK